MKAKILYGILLFFVGVAMVACGDKGSKSAATPNNNLEPAIPVTGDGILNPNNTQCGGQVCTYSGEIKVTNAQNFAALGATPRFYDPNNNNNQLVIGEDIRNPRDFFEAIFGNLTFGININTDGDITTGIGFDGGVNGQNNLNNQGNLIPLNQMQNSYQAQLQVDSNRIRGSYTVPGSGIQGFEAVVTDLGTGNIRIYVDQANKIALYTSPTANGRLTQIGVALFVNGDLGEAGVFTIRKVY